PISQRVHAERARSITPRARMRARASWIDAAEHDADADVDVAAGVAGATRALRVDRTRAAIDAELGADDRQVAHRRADRATVAAAGGRTPRRHRAHAAGEHQTRAAVPQRGRAAVEIGGARVADLRMPAVLADGAAAVEAAVALAHAAVAVHHALVDAAVAGR